MRDLACDKPQNPFGEYITLDFLLRTLDPVPVYLFAKHVFFCLNDHTCMNACSPTSGCDFAMTTQRQGSLQFCEHSIDL